MCSKGYINSCNVDGAIVLLMVVVCSRLLIGCMILFLLHAFELVLEPDHGTKTTFEYYSNVKLTCFTCYIICSRLVYS